MSYDLQICVKVEDTGLFAVIDTPERDNPTYNLKSMFVACMDWDYKQGKEYRCDEVVDKIMHGISELTLHPREYDKYSPPNGWGTLRGALDCLQSLIDCIMKNAEEIPLHNLWMRW